MTKPFHVEHIGHARCYGCTRAEAKLDDMTLERDRLAARLESSNDTVASLQTELRDAFAETEAVKARLAEVERERKELCRQSDIVASKAVDDLRQIGALKADVADLRKQLATAEELLRLYIDYDKHKRDPKCGWDDGKPCYNCRTVDYFAARATKSQE